jgi:hypothetical protein
MITPQKTTSIIIDDPNVIITKSFDGDMVFRDNFVPGVKLKELMGVISGGQLVLDPAIVVGIETSNYTYLPTEALYAVSIPTNFNLSLALQMGVIVEVYDSNYIKITVDTIQTFQNYIYMKVFSPDNVYVVIKRVV